jgi:hypothetical protein
MKLRFICAVLFVAGMSMVIGIMAGKVILWLS